MSFPTLSRTTASLLLVCLKRPEWPGAARLASKNRSRTVVPSLIDPLIAFVSAHAWLAYLTIFLAALLEAVPIIGSVIPGSTMILALSALIPAGDGGCELDLAGVFASAIAGAALGDGAAFWIGH